MKDPREIPLDFTPQDPELARHRRVMAKRTVHRRNMAERKQERAALANKGKPSGCR